ncbi:hypothetical protein EV421DRAFT_1501221 [Armillaria borealis]|uniref:Uncharacterized protein n=1 Tax=Armillaria borealis TaxID=47425 RepID=A0AA39MFK3_9AGAR|nr:hypothetical protein EV421DRAFT_1501221 [Armillaria borealis]
MIRHSRSCGFGADIFVTLRVCGNYSTRLYGLWYFSAHTFTEGPRDIIRRLHNCRQARAIWTANGAQHFIVGSPWRLACSVLQSDLRNLRVANRKQFRSFSLLTHRPITHWCSNMNWTPPFSRILRLGLPWVTIYFMSMLFHQANVRGSSAGKLLQPKNEGLVNRSARLFMHEFTPRGLRVVSLCADFADERSSEDGWSSENQRDMMKVLVIFGCKFNVHLARSIHPHHCNS